MEHNNIYRSVFKVTHSGGSGSCFYLKNYDLFVTNYHVVEGYRTVAVHDNDRNPYLAKVRAGSIRRWTSPCWPPKATLGAAEMTLAAD